MQKNIKPVKTYTCLEENKFIIYKENKAMSGIYRWTNNINGKSYIGSAVDLRARLGNYFSIKFLEKELIRNRSIISNALIKYGYNEFSLDILEYCSKEMLIIREQYYMDNTQCEYNILKKAASALGVKRSPETLAKLRLRRFKPEALIKMSLIKKNKPQSFSILRKKNLLLAIAHKTILINIQDNTVEVYESMISLAKHLGVSKTTIRNYKDKDIIIKNNYIIRSYKR